MRGVGSTSLDWTYHVIIRAIFCTTGVSGGKLHLDEEESEPALVSRVNALHPAAHRRGHVLTYTCARKHLPTSCLLEGVHAKFRTYQTETQNSGYLINAVVRGCLLRGCFFPPAFVVCFPVLTLQRFLRGSVGKVSGCLGINRSLHNCEGNVQRDEVLTQPLLTAGGLD